jgi:hypothetical protein
VEALRGIRDEARIVGRRLALLGFVHARVKVVGMDRLAILIPGANDSNMRTVYGAISRSQGKLDVFELADAAAQEAFNRSRQVLEGYFTVRNPSSEERRALPEDRLGTLTPC